MKIIYESTEHIEAIFPAGKESITYRGQLQVRDGGATPVSLELRFVPPHPFIGNMPDQYSIRGKSVTEVYVKLIRFLRRMGFQLR